MLAYLNNHTSISPPHLLRWFQSSPTYRLFRLSGLTAYMAAWITRFLQEQNPLLEPTLSALLQDSCVLHGCVADTTYVYTCPLQ
jgi:hypothetical protein